MEVLPVTPGQAKNWRALYRAAVTEQNRSLIQQRVSEAEYAIIARVHQLFDSPGTLDETEALEDALYILHALQTGLAHTDAA